MQMKRYPLILSFIVLSVQLHAQEMWGVANSYYAGSMGHDLNPASITGNPFRWELHLLSMDVSAMNNFMYLQRHSQAFKTGMNGEGVSQDKFKVRVSNSDKNANVDLFVKAPSFMYSTPKWGLGFHVATKMALSVNGVPYHFANFMKEGFDFTQQQNADYSIKNMSMAAMNWHEAGLTGGLTLVNQPEAFITAGVTLNYLYGMNGFYLNINDFNYNVPSDTLWQISLANMEYGYAFPDENSSFLQKRGSGFSTSVGMQYYRNRNDAAYDNCSKVKGVKKYDYKMGFSVIDIGKINFNSQASTFSINDAATNWYGIDSISPSSLSNTDSMLNSQFFGAQMTMNRGNSFDLWMPAAASFQFDYACSPSFYLNFSAIQRLPMGEHAIKRPNQLSVTARFEMKRFEVAVPYSFYDYFRHRIGLSLRYSFLTVGTDMMGPFTGISDAYGLNFYVGIRWQHFESCARKQRKADKKKVSADCYTDFK